MDVPTAPGVAIDGCHTWLRTCMRRVMRTTLILDDRLVRQAKRRAADTGSTLGEVVNDALREALRPVAEPVPPFRMITYGSPDEPFHLTPEDIKETELQKDLDPLRWP